MKKKINNFSMIKGHKNNPNNKNKKQMMSF
jgi:hypothetical protein